MERKPKLLKSSKVVDSSGKHETKMKVEDFEKKGPSESVQDVSIDIQRHSRFKCETADISTSPSEQF